ncbi:macrophage mannose receptor 1-like [Dreissena polymorpha]|uniref:macrophage mannose receptor 1-like n=1 Tax=Dreissena polymorpha TaxID=45954 RepID=UPI0022642974|nr:macrophage mannose receptor 1-like [Dreissena polymorpha]
MKMTDYTTLAGLLFVLCVPGALSDNLCDDGWLPYGSNCYKFDTTKRVSVASAQAECSNLGANLLRIHSSDELTWITTTAKASFPSAGFWTDLNDNPKTSLTKLGTGKWQWGMFETVDMSLLQWGTSPVNDGVANCAGMNILGTLSDLNCLSLQGFICKLPGQSGCPLGWLSYGTACYWISDTTNATRLLSWNDAKLWCADPSRSNANGAQLMSVADQNDLNFLTNNLPYQTPSATVFWIGYTSTNGQWGWLTGSTSAVTVPWQTAPNNVAGIENCGVLRMTGVFDDRDCSSSSNFICYQQQYNTQTADNLGCGQWIRGGKLCYGFIGNSQTANWQDARSYCKKRGADLVKIDSYDKQAWLSQQMTDPANDAIFWTGLNDQKTEGAYVWADGSPANQSYIKWNQEPNNYKGQENCGLIYTTGQYNDQTCSLKAAAICEIDNLSPCPNNSWYANNNNCYLFTPFDPISSLMNQQEATSFCASLSGKTNNVAALLSVETTDEHDFIKTTVGSPQLSANEYGWWTSLTDKQTEGFWMFATGPVLDSSVIDWTGEPSTRQGDNCGLVTFGGQFHERVCSLKIRFICERLAYGVTSGSAREYALHHRVAAVIVSFLSMFILSPSL